MKDKKRFIEIFKNQFADNVYKIFFLWAFWLTFEYFILGPFSFFPIQDNGDFIPMRFVLYKTLSIDGFSNWFPYAVSGVDRLSFLNFFQIDDIFYIIFPKWLAFGLIKFIGSFLGGYFTFRLCIDHFKIDKMPSIVAGLAYSILSLQTIVQFVWIFGGLPFILWSLEYINMKSGIYRYFYAFFLGLLAFFSSSFTINAPFAIVIVFIWFAFIRKIYSIRSISTYCIFTGVILIGNMPLILILLHNAPLSHRAYWPLINPIYGGFEGMLTSYLLVATKFLKSHFIFWVPGVLGLIWIKFNDKRFLSVMSLLAFCGIMIYIISPFWIFIKPYIGFFSGFQVDRFYIFTPFFAAMGLGFGLHYLMRGWVISSPKCTSDSKKIHIQTILCILLAILLVSQSFQIKIDNGEYWGGHGSYLANYNNPDLQNLANNTNPTPFRVATVAYAALHPAFANAYGLETVDGYVPLYPKRYQDFWGKVIEPSTLNDTEIYTKFYNFNNRIYLFAPYENFNEFNEIQFSEYYNLNLLSLANTKYIISRKAMSNENLILLPSQIPQPEREWAELSTIEQVKRGFNNNFKGRGLYIYENKNVFPRFFVVDQLEAFPDSIHLLDSMANSNITRLHATVFMEEQFASNIEVDKLGFNSAKVIIEEYSPDKIILEVDLDGNGVLVITNSYNPQWTAHINGIEKEIYPVYHTFSSVYLESGQNTIVLEYRPPYGFPSSLEYNN